MNPPRLLAASAIVGSCGLAANAASQDAMRHIGETGTVCGVVASAKFEVSAVAADIIDLESRIRMRFLPRSSMTSSVSSAPETCSAVSASV